MLVTAVVSGGLLIGAVLAVVGLIALVICLPDVIVREAKENPSPSWMGTVRARRARLRAILGVMGGLAIVVVVWGWASYEPPKTARVVIDNNSEETLTLRFEGSEVLVIAPHSRPSWKCSPGRKRIILVAGQTTVFDQEVDVADRGKYIANPDATNHYAIWAQEYTKDFGLPNPLAKATFRDLQAQARRIQLIEPAKWHEVTADYVLEIPPALIQSSSPSGSERRTIVSILSRESYNVLHEAQSKRPDDPVHDTFIEQLSNALTSVMFSMPGFGDDPDDNR